MSVYVVMIDRDIKKEARVAHPVAAICFPKPFIDIASWVLPQMATTMLNDSCI